MRHPTKDHQALFECLQAFCQSTPKIRAAWIGGSYAFDSQDQLSDLDLVMVAEEQDAGALMDAVAARLEQEFGLDLRCDMPSDPDPHAFMRTKAYGELLLVDCLIARPALLAKQINKTQHGTPVVLHDPEGLIAEAMAGSEARKEPLLLELRAALPKMLDRFAMLSPFLEKAVKRQDLGEALFGYHFNYLSTLIRLLRARYCPERQNFGLRYLRQDLPEEVSARLEALLTPDSLGTIAEKAKIIRAWIGEQIAWCQRQAWWPDAS